ncbi:MAG: hypothetical protein IMY67_11300 [Bacteroidetes bacterium]|nr:hypothetical protein [Bacteroidota bacterium]
MSKEHKLQVQMAVKFSQQRPEEKGLLWSTRNITLSVRDGQKQKAMGMIKGVADLIYYKQDDFVAIEVKYPGEKHHKNQVEIQYNWGMKITEQGGYYFIVTSLEGFWSIIEGFTEHKDVYSLKQIKDKLDNSGSTVIF